MYQGSNIEEALNDLIRTVESVGCSSNNSYDVHRAMSKSLRRNGLMLAWRDQRASDVVYENGGFTTAKMPKWVLKLLLKLKWVR